MLLQENSFNDEGSNKPIFVPRPSFTQQGVYDALYRLCWDENRFIGPWFEIRCGRCSLDIVFYAKNGEKICYEIDCDDYHDKVKDKNRDFYLKKLWDGKSIEWIVLGLMHSASIQQQICYTNTYWYCSAFGQDLLLSISLQVFTKKIYTKEPLFEVL